MKISRKLWLSLLVTLIIGGSWSCSSSHRRDELTVLEALRLQLATAEFHVQINSEEYSRIRQSRTVQAIYGCGEKFAGYFGGVKAKYGPILSSRLIKANITSDPEDSYDMVAASWYETQGVKGKYVEWLVWHLMEDGNTLGLYQLYEYDEQGQLYATLTLQTGLDPKDTQTTKVPLGR